MQQPNSRNVKIGFDIPNRQIHLGIPRGLLKKELSTAEFHTYVLSEEEIGGLIQHLIWSKETLDREIARRP